MLKDSLLLSLHCLERKAPAYSGIRRSYMKKKTAIAVIARRENYIRFMTEKLSLFLGDAADFPGYDHSSGRLCRTFLLLDFSASEAQTQKVCQGHYAQT